MRRLRFATLLLCSLIGLAPLTGCGRGGAGLDDHAAGAKALAASDVPRVTGATWAAPGQLAVSGVAAPDAIVRMSSPEGQSWGTTAGADGAWSFTLPVAATPRMVSLSAEQSGRVMHADGALIVSPQPGVPFVIARAGYGSRGPELRRSEPLILALDFDRGGGALISGVAKPGASVRLLVDGAQTGETRASENGEFVVPSISRPLGVGDHQFRVETADGVAVTAAKIQDAPPLTSAYRATAAAEGWRLDWRTPSGGIQSTLIFASAAPAFSKTVAGAAQ